MDGQRESQNSASVSRRRALGALGVGAAGGMAMTVASASAAVSAPDDAPVLTVVPLTGQGDEAGLIQAAVDGLGANGGVVILPPGVFEVGTPVRLASGITLIGAGQKATLLRDHPSLGGRAIIEVVGTRAERLRDVRISDLGIRNGTATAGRPTAGKNGVVVEFCTGFSLERCLVTEIVGNYGLKTKYANNILVQGCTFYRCTDSMLYVLVECEDVRVLDNLFDTLTSKALVNTYAFATGSERRGEGEWWVRNVWVERNVVRNNPIWEGLDCHGGENVHFRNNYVENCKIGIAVQNARGWVASAVLRDIHIDGNTIRRGNGMPGNRGITVVGNVDALTENVSITRNSVRGFTGHSDAPGSISVYIVKDVRIEKNEVQDFSVYGVHLTNAVFGASVVDNNFQNVVDTPDGQEGNTAAIGIDGLGAYGDTTGDVVGAYGVTIRGNSLGADSPDRRAQWFLKVGHRDVSVQVGTNMVRSARQPVPFGGVEFLPVERGSKPKDGLVQAYRDVITDDLGRPKWVVSKPKSGFGALGKPRTIARISMEAGSALVKVVSGDWRKLPPGMTVAVAGAGDDGRPLFATVLDYTVTNRIHLDRVAAATVTDAELTYRSLELTELD
jgi:hypothetical protein